MGRQSGSVSERTSFRLKEESERREREKRKRKSIFIQRIIKLKIITTSAADPGMRGRLVLPVPICRDCHLRCRRCRRLRCFRRCRRRCCRYCCCSCSCLHFHFLMPLCEIHFEFVSIDAKIRRRSWSCCCCSCSCSGMALVAP